MRAKLVRLGEIALIRQGMSFSGHGSGSRAGSWELGVVSVGNLQDDRLDLIGIQRARVAFTPRTERHLLEPGDVLVTARSTVVKAARVESGTPASLVADTSLMVVRARETWMSSYIWWFFTSAHGRRKVLARMAGSSTLLFLSAANLAEVEIPLPPEADVLRLATLADASERAYAAGLEAARLRREAFREATIERLLGAARQDQEDVDAVDSE